jgi:tetratricopeptide (TPR) repeat protein
LNSFHPGSRTARVVDQLLDLLLAGVLLGAPLIFYTKAYDVFEFNKITALRVLCSLAAPLLLFKLLFVRPYRITRSALDLPVLAWLAVCFACTFHTVNWRLSVHGVFEDFEGITTWCMYVFLFWWPLQHIRTERQIRLVLGVVALAGTLAGFYGLLQNFGIDFVPWNPDTYSATRMFSTMGNPNFLAAYTVMSMPITFVLFLDLPDQIHTDQAFCAVLVVLGLVASAGLCSLFNVNFFSFNPADFGAADAFHMLTGLKFWVTKTLMVFPLICAALLYFGRLRWVLLLSLVGQLASTLFTKSRGGVFSMVAIVAVFGLAFAYEIFGKKALFSLKGLLSALGLVLVGGLVFATGVWEPALKFAFEDHPAPAFLVFLGLLAGLRFVLKRRGGQDRFSQGLDYVLALLVIVWALLFIPTIRQTTYEMLERTSKLFHPSEVKYTPRLFIWKAALAMLRDNPWLGKGLDTFQISFPPYREAIYWLLEWNGTPEKSHNFVMQTAATMGGLGLLAFVWMHAAWIRSSFRDWRRQSDERRRLLILACFGAWLGFFVQNLFSFTVVGYGVLWWVLWGFVPAMQRTWESEGAPAEPISGGGSAWSSPLVAWRVGVGVFSLILLAAALAGPSFFATQDFWPLRLATAVIGLGALVWVLFMDKDAPQAGAGTLGYSLLAAVSVGAFFFAWHSSKIWVADSFYKQGQVGMSVNQPGYAAAMYQKGTGQLRDVTPAQVDSIHLPEVPTDPAQRLKITPGLNPDQELYWVKMGIAFEAAAAQATKPDDKLLYYRTALAIHQYTLEMNPINGYNYNNKGRVLKAMGEAFKQPGYFERALQHYDKAIELDKHNVYFNLDKANTLLSLGRPAEALAVCQHLMELFPDFAVPYSYAGFIKMQAGQKPEAIQYFSKAVAGEWYRDNGSRALAATNLGMLQRQAGHLPEAEHAFREALISNPAQQEAALNLADILLRARRGVEGVQVLQALLKAVPGQPQALETLKRLGVQP